ncbi:bcl-2-like protein 13 [Chanodichthys erythropterus]|uniref:bcl-2-like protein 13 n=1 Tax=Chanodichthys erythropterus TaxID=933992 RepID=UPI00351E1515
MEPMLGSLETSEMVLVQEDHSENHSSTSDIIHLEAELHERVESDDEEDLQSSMLSMIGSDRELAEIGAHVTSAAESDLKPPQTGELLMCVEEPVVEEIETEVDSEPVFTHTPLLSEPSDFTLASVPIPEIISQVFEHLPPSEITLSEESHTNVPSMSQDHTTSSSEEDVSKAGPLSTSPFELPVLIVGGAALVALVGVLVYRHTLSRK